MRMVGNVPGLMQSPDAAMQMLAEAGLDQVVEHPVTDMMDELGQPRPYDVISIMVAHKPIAGEDTPAMPEPADVIAAAPEQVDLIAATPEQADLIAAMPEPADLITAAPEPADLIAAAPVESSAESTDETAMTDDDPVI